MMKKLTMVLACLFLSIGMALAQSTVSGTVVSKTDGQPVIGATVKVVGVNMGAVTDANGRFSFVAPQGAKKVEVSYVGMITQEIAISSNMRVVLAEDPKVLDEVMVVAYGTTKKSSFTGSAESIDSKDMELRPITSATKAIEGHVTGVQTTSGSGQPGSSPSIIIRGFGSINASTSPLYVVDGIPYDGSIASINPSDIESMTILKDASAGALYGARGANGVVMITTKKGKEGKPEVTWRSTVGWNSRSLKPYDNVNMKEFVQLLYEAYRNDNVYKNGMDWEAGEAAARAALSGKLGGELYNPFKNYTWDTIIDPATGQVRPDAQAAWDENWMDEIQRKNAFRHEHQFQIAGGSERTKYMMSLGYLNEDGILKTTNFQRYSARVNVQSEVTDWFSANLNASLGHSIQNFSRFEDSATSNVWYTAQFINPLLPVYIKNPDGTNALGADGKPQFDYGENGRPGTMTDFSVLGGLYDDVSDVRADIASVRTGFVFGSDSDRFGWAKGIKLALNFGLDYDNRNQMEYYNMYHGNQANAGGLIYKTNGRTQSYTFNQLLTWNRSFGKHNFDVLAGHEFYEYKYSYLNAGKSNLVDGIYELRPGTTLQDADSYSDVYRIDSWLSRFNYNFADKYYFSASVRSDKSSRFYKDNNRGTFWSLGANWRVTGEEFMKNVKWVDNLSFKVSYGEQGNDNLGSYYAWQSLYNLAYANGDNVGGVITSLETKDVSWEKNGNFNIGLEGALFDKRVRFNFEYYYRKTTDMLLSYPMAVSTGFDGYNANVGDMRNTGVEMEVTVTPVKTKDLIWDITLMGNTISNKALKLTQESPEIVSSISVIKEGMPINTFYLPKSAGVDPTNGDELYWAYKKDDDGNKIEGSEYITKNTAEATNSRYYLDSRIPDFYGSIGTNLNWKGIDLSVLTTYSIGGKIFDNLYRGSMNVMYVDKTWNRNVLRRWQQPGDITDVPRMSFNSTSIATDRYLIDASYFAIKNITLGYTFPTSLVNSWGLGGLKVFASADNLVQFNHLDGMNPQYNFGGSTNYTYVPNKTISLGLEVKF